MSVSTYSELQAAIVSRAHRTDLAALAPEFIALAEARLNRVPKLRTMEIEASLVCVVGSRFISLPGDYVSPVALSLLESARQPLVPLLAASLPIAEDGAMPQYWAIDGTKIAFECPPDQAYPAYFRYLARFALSESVTTNWLLTTNPDVYLYAGLVQVAIHTEDDAALARWKGFYDEALAEVKQGESRSKPALLMTEFGGGGRSNILRGY